MFITASRESHYKIFIWCQLQMCCKLQQATTPAAIKQQQLQQIAFAKLVLDVMTSNTGCYSMILWTNMAAATTVQQQFQSRFIYHSPFDNNLLACNFSGPLVSCGRWRYVYVTIIVETSIWCRGRSTRSADATSQWKTTECNRSNMQWATARIAQLNQCMCSNVGMCVCVCPVKSSGDRTCILHLSI